MERKEDAVSINNNYHGDSKEVQDAVKVGMKLGENRWIGRNSYDNKNLRKALKATAECMKKEMYTLRDAELIIKGSEAKGRADTLKEVLALQVISDGCNCLDLVRELKK